MSEQAKKSYLRELELMDAQYMLEWMHDVEIQKCFQKDMMNRTLKDAEEFILDSMKKTGKDRHWAIINDEGEYIGTASLKDIDMSNKHAEYAIAMRRSAVGNGYGYKATMEILKKAFYEFDLHRVFLTVLENNHRAIKMYEKCGFIYEGILRNHLVIENEYIGWKIYGILKDEYELWGINQKG